MWNYYVVNFFSLVDDITTLMTQTEDLQDYYPFSRKIFTLLYLLVNSPHPFASYIHMH